MTLIFPNRLLLPHGRKAALEVSKAISKIINEKIVIAITPATKNQSLTSKYEAAVDINIGCKIDAGLIICTSGSTGNPKAVEISSQALINAANMTNKKLGSKADWLLAINPAFMGGLMVLARVMQSEQNWEYGLDENDKFNPNLFIAKAQEMFANNKKVRTSLVTAQLISLVSQGYTNILKNFDAILVGGGYFPHNIFEELKKEGVNLIRTYGMTETCGGIVWDGKTLEDVLIRIENPNNSGAGRISIKSPTNATSYHGDSPDILKLNNLTFNNGWVLTQDVGTFTDGNLKVIGRSDDIVISGGTNISIHAVEDVIRNQPGVEDAVVFAIPDDKWGNIISALIVGQSDQLQIQDAVEKELGKAAMPRVVKFTKDIPLLPNGKIDMDAIK